MSGPVSESVNAPVIWRAHVPALAVLLALVALGLAVACWQASCSRAARQDRAAANAVEAMAGTGEHRLADKPAARGGAQNTGIGGPKPVAREAAPGAAPGAAAETGTTVTVNGHTVTAPAGARVTVIDENIGEDSEIRSKGEANGDHPITSANQKNAASDAGKTDWAALVDLAKATDDPKFTGLVILGGLLIVAGCVAGIWLGQVSLGLALGAGGAALVALGVVAETSPWLIAVGLIGGVIAVALVWWHARGAKGHALVASTLTEAVEAHDPDGSRGLKNAVARVAARGGALERVKAAVRRVKKTIGIPADRATAARVNGGGSNASGGTGQGGPPPPAA